MRRGALLPASAPVLLGPAVLSLALSACSGPRLPEGTLRCAPDLYAHDFQWDPAGGAVFYLSGRFPKKTYFGRCDPATGRASSFRVPGFALEAPYALLDEGRRALVAAQSVGDPMAGTSGEPHLLLLDVEKGALLKGLVLPDGMALLAAGQPRQEGPAYALFQVPDKVLLRTLDPGAQELSAPRPVGSFEARRALALPGKPEFVLDVLEASKTKLVWLDAEAGRTLGEFPIESASDELRAGAGRVLTVAPVPGDRKGVLRELDLVKAAVRDLATFDGELESVLDADPEVWVLARDTSRSSVPRKPWMHPRRLHVLRSGFPSATAEWTSRKGRFLGYDPQKRRLGFAVTDGDDPGVWLVPARAESVPSLAPLLDRHYFGLGSHAAKWAVGLLAIVLPLIVVLVVRSFF